MLGSLILANGSIFWMEALILIFLCAILHQRPSAPTQETSPQVKESVRQLISSLPPKSEWRKMLQRGVEGDGIHKPWMDAMTKAGVRLALYDFEFKWTNSGRKLSDWKLVEEQYFADYDRSKSLANATVDHIKADGLAGALETEALARAKDGNWFEYPPENSGTGYRRIVLADNEWLPVQVVFRFFVSNQPDTTPLMRAAELGELQRIQKLLEEGADVNAVSANGSTALVYAASSGNSAAVETLLNAGAKARASAGGEALITAAATGNARNVELLLKAGADPNYREKDGATALSVASQRHFGEIVKLLQHAGAQE